jgi:hypothetical protein
MLSYECAEDGTAKKMATLSMVGAGEKATAEEKKAEEKK